MPPTQPHHQHIPYTPCHLPSGLADGENKPYGTTKAESVTIFAAWAKAGCSASKTACFEDELKFDLVSCCTTPDKSSVGVRCQHLIHA